MNAVNCPLEALARLHLVDIEAIEGAPLYRPMFDNLARVPAPGLAAEPKA